MRVTPVLSPEVAQARRRRPRGRGARIHHHHPRDALAAEPRDRAPGRGRGARGGRRARDHRRDGRAAPHRPRRAATLERLAQATGVMKLSRADLAACLATGRHRGHHRRRHDDRARIWRGSRSSPRAASAACIAAPRRASTSRPTCANCRETPVTVVAAGAKAILDLPKTLESSRRWACPSSPSGRTTSPPSGRAARASLAPLRMDSARRHRPRPPDARGARAAGRAARRQPDPAEAEIPRADVSPRSSTARWPRRGAGHRGQGGDALPPVAHLRADRRPLARPRTSRSC
jgi:hypothetical protein